MTRLKCGLSLLHCAIRLLSDNGPRSLQGERSQRGTRNRQCILFIIVAIVLVVLFLVLSS